MNAFKKVSFNLSEASTKRGIALFVAGSVALYHLFLGAGDAPNPDAITARAEFWLSIGAQLSGLIGMFIADEPKSIHVNLPPLDLQGRATAPSPLVGEKRRSVPLPPRGGGWGWGGYSWAASRYRGAGGRAARALHRA